MSHTGVHGVGSRLNARRKVSLANSGMVSARSDDIKVATNYVNQALGEAFDGKAISAAATRPYGCSIKYKS